MCLTIKMTTKEKRQWLAKKPDEMITYKVMTYRNSRYYPPWFNRYKPFNGRGTNRIETIPRKILYYFGERRIEYVPYYHLFVTEQAANSFLKENIDWTMYWEAAVVKRCKIFKRDVTNVGKQDGLRVIVAKDFKFSREYKRKEE